MESRIDLFDVGAYRIRFHFQGTWHGFRKKKSITNIIKLCKSLGMENGEIEEVVECAERNRNSYE